MNIENLLSHVFHLYVLRTQNRDLFVDHLSKNGISTLIHYPISPHRQQAYAEYRSYDLPVTEALEKEIVSIPMYPTLSATSQQKIITTINAFQMT
jgi:dTDP-4-amino-4,6-dideoxygalactose transaminase